MAKSAAVKSTGNSLASLDEKYCLILCDLWGCVHDGVAPFDGVLDLLREWRAQGRVVVFLTNAPRPMASVVQQLDGLAIGEDCYDAVTSSGDAALAYIAKHHEGEVFGFIGQEKDRAALSAAGIALSDSVIANTFICSGFHDDRTNDLDSYDDVLNEAMGHGAEMLCLNPDIFVLRGGKKELCAGAIAQRYRDLGGKVIEFGKPAATIYDRAFELAHEASGEKFSREAAIAIGDNMATDLAGAQAYGLDFIFVANGIEAERIAEHGESLLSETFGQKPNAGFNLVAIVEGLR